MSILGGGPAGLAAAFYAWRRGIPFVLFEGSQTTGGLCRTLSCGPHAYDTGAHLFHDRFPGVTEDLRELLGEDLRPVTSPSKVCVSGRFLDFPPTPVNVLRSSNPVELGRSLADLIRSRLRKRPTESFADYAVNSFGETLARKFLLNYSEKVWGLPAEQLSIDVATRRLSGMTLGTLFVELFFPRRKTAHIDGSFLYPRGGYGRICRVLEARLPEETVRTDHRVSGLDCVRDRVCAIEFEHGASSEVKGQELSTLSITFLARLLGSRLSPEVHHARRQLRFRSIRLLFLRLSQDRVSNNATIYLPDRRLCVSRVHEPQNRCASMAPRGETSLVAEVPFFTDEAIAGLPAEQLLGRVADELEEVGLTRRSNIIVWRHHVLANAYPVYSRDYAKHVAVIRRGLEKFRNLHSLGRNGRYFYSHLHHQMRTAKELVNSFAGASSPGLETGGPPPP